MMWAPRDHARSYAVATLLLLPGWAACDGGSHSGDGHDHDHESVLPPPTLDAGPEPADGGAADTFDWHLPQGFPRPVVPADNPMTAEKVELGRHIFYDKRMSDNQTFSCASCHKQSMAFADERA